MNICGDDECRDPDCPGSGRHPFSQVFRPGDQILVVARVVDVVDSSQSIDLTVDIYRGEGRMHRIDITDSQVYTYRGEPSRETTE